MTQCDCSRKGNRSCPYCVSTCSHSGLTADAKCRSVNLGAKTLAVEFEAALVAFEENRLDEALQLVDAVQAQWPTDGPTAQLKCLILRAMEDDNSTNQPQIPRVIRFDEK